MHASELQGLKEHQVEMWCNAQALQEDGAHLGDTAWDEWGDWDEGWEEYEQEEVVTPGDIQVPGVDREHDEVDATAEGGETGEQEFWEMPVPTSGEDGGEDLEGQSQDETTEGDDAEGGGDDHQGTGGTEEEDADGGDDDQQWIGEAEWGGCQRGRRRPGRRWTRRLRRRLG